MPFNLPELKQGDNTLWRWLSEASGKDVPTLKTMAGISDAKTKLAPGDLGTLKLENRNKIYYLYMLFHEFQQRITTSDLSTWLEQPLSCDWSAEEQSWQIRYLKLKYYYKHYLKASAEEVKEDIGCTAEDNP